MKSLLAIFFLIFVISVIFGSPIQETSTSEDDSQEELLKYISRDKQL